MIATAQRTATVLVIDDDHDVRKVTSILLERAGYTVLAAPDAEEGLDVLGARSDDIDVVLLDIMMPGMTGKDALPRIRELRADLPVVFFSGYGRDEVAEHLAEDPHTSFLAKPSDIATLAGEIARAVTEGE